MNPKPSKRQRFKNFILRRKLNTLGLLVITLMSGLITLACTDILIFVTVLLVILCFVQKVKLKKSFRTLPHHFKSAQRIHSRENDEETPEA